MAIVTDWKIKSRSGICHHTGRQFEDEEPFYTCIFDDPESDGFIRRDYSATAWEELSATLDPAPFSFWRSVFRIPRADTPDETLKHRSAEAMLYRMIEEDRSGTENARYILALMLERKKVLIPTETRRTETRTLLFYEHRESGAVYIVADPGLRLEEVGRIQEEVSQLLAEEECREASGQSTEAVEVSEHEADTDGADPEQDGEDAAEAEEKPVPRAGEEPTQE